ncbi:ABC transporter ATP-binding protein [Desulfosarcina sp.]|uniref:ABC transporter ATP-binding protein n=1 Tax=Desulfosarcina sp. TaxID=2027861 RepID=UPI0029B910B8|nr:ABC transporter ATP-binding protein [Desulfosarcina sp.]MDX2455424.1 ABC transporter ATP-binding protein [Desulfosarcina sp.]MDX2492923.1 ABC transporter ATP-binding protein [Desulfosarcina sp.]
MKLPTLLGGVRRSLFFRLTLNAATQSAFLLITAIIVRFAFDHFLDHPSIQWKVMLLVGSAMVASAMVSGWLQRSERIIAEELGQSYVHKLRRQLFQHVTRIDPQQLQKRRKGAVMLKFIGDLSAIRRWVSLGVVRIIVSGAIVASTLVVLSQIDWVLSVVSAAIIACGTAANARVGKKLRLAAIDARKRRSRLSANVNEKISQMAVVQVFGRSAKEINRVRKHSQSLRRSLVNRAGEIGLIRGINYGVTAAMTTAVLMTGIVRVNSGHTTPGTIAAAIAVMGFLVPALRNLGRIYEYFQEASVARQKLSTFLTIPTRIKQGDHLPELKAGPGKLIFEGVAASGVLENFSGAIEPGQKIALIGPNGAGKSTLLSLIARMIEPQRGRVFIDNQDISTVRLASVRKAIGMVGPDLPLLSGSLYMNIRYRCPDCTQAEIEHVWKICGIDALVRDLPKGEQTHIHERGRNLSAGQRQRIALARALLGSPRILLLDEVDSHLDAEARNLLINAIQAYPGTVLWATHLEEPLYGVDAVWRIENRKITCHRPEKRQLRAVG